MPNKRALEEIASALEEIESHFEWQGFPSGSSDKSDEAEGERQSKEAEEEKSETAEDEEEYFDESDEYTGPSVYDREDIEVSIDVFTSELIRKKVITKSKFGERPSFSRVFEGLFGTDHEIAELANSFEEYVEGYFGFVSYDDMAEAQSVLQQIKDIITKEIANGKN
jgi:hypothetical protein